MTECPEWETGPYHFWEMEGPDNVVCRCGAEGRIIETEGPDAE